MEGKRKLETIFEVEKMREEKKRLSSLK